MPPSTRPTVGDILLITGGVKLEGAAGAVVVVEDAKMRSPETGWGGGGGGEQLLPVASKVNWALDASGWPSMLVNSKGRSRKSLIWTRRSRASMPVSWGLKARWDEMRFVDFL